jgi:hypothetical protein
MQRWRSGNWLIRCVGGEREKKKGFSCFSSYMMTEKIKTRCYVSELCSIITTHTTYKSIHCPYTYCVCIYIYALMLYMKKVAVKERRKAFNDLMEYRGNIRVLCRVRDPSSEQKLLSGGNGAGTSNSAASASADSFHGGASGVKLDGDSIAVTHGHTSETKRWTFPRVFPLDVSQEEVFEEVMR